MSRILRLMALCCAALCSQMTFAQPRVIGIDELFRLAEEQSMSIRSFESGAAAAAEGVRAARAERLPDVGVTVSASFLGDGRLWDRSFGEGMKVDIPHFGNNFALEAQQVVYAGGAVRSGIRMAELEQRDAETSLERNRQDICFLLLGHYLNLYNIASLFKSGRRIRQAELYARRARESYDLECERVDNAVQESYVNLMTAEADLRTQQKSVELADENYAVVSNRYANDLALLTDMLDAGNTKLEADLALVEARINLIYDYYRMKYVTHTL